MVTIVLMSNIYFIKS